MDQLDQIKSPNITTYSSVGGIVGFRQLRLEFGEKRRPFAERLGINVGTLGRIERGEQAYTDDILFRLSKALYCQPSFIILAIDRSVSFLKDKGWEIVAQLEDNEVDSLLVNCEAFFKQRAENDDSLFIKNGESRVPVLLSQNPPPSLRYATGDID